MMMVMVMPGSQSCECLSVWSCSQSSADHRHQHGLKSGLRNSDCSVHRMSIFSFSARSFVFCLSRIGIDIFTLYNIFTINTGLLSRNKFSVCPTSFSNLNFSNDLKVRNINYGNYIIKPICNIEVNIIWM